MKNLRLTKKQFKQIEECYQLIITLGGFPAYCIRDAYGDFRTPSGVRFSVNFYAPSYYDLKINGEKQIPLEEYE